MNTQVQVVIPEPIIKEIIALSELKEKLSFRQSCKEFFLFTNREFFPTITTTVCGSEGRGYKDGDAPTTKFHNTKFGALDSSNILYVSDYFNHSIRRIDLSQSGYPLWRSNN